MIVYFGRIYELLDHSKPSAPSSTMFLLMIGLLSFESTSVILRSSTPWSLWALAWWYFEIRWVPWSFEIEHSVERNGPSHDVYFEDNEHLNRVRSRTLSSLWTLSWLNASNCTLDSFEIGCSITPVGSRMIKYYRFWSICHKSTLSFIRLLFSPFDLDLPVFYLFGSNAHVQDAISIKVRFAWHGYCDSELAIQVVKSWKKNKNVTNWGFLYISMRKKGLVIHKFP